MATPQRAASYTLARRPDSNTDRRSASFRDRLLDIQGLSFAYSGSGLVLKQVDLSLEAGQCVCLTGPSGCGKTTLLKAVMSLLPPEAMSGRISWNGGGPPARGMVFQNHDSQLLCTTVSDETAFAPQNLGLDRNAVSSRVVRALESVGLCGLEDRNVEELSAGQKARLCLASVLSLEPRLLILDEPCGQMDASGRQAMLHALADLKARGMTLLIAEHNLPALDGLVDEYLELDREGRSLGQGPLHALEGGSPAQTWPRCEPGAIALEARGLCLDGPEGPLFEDLDLSLQAGQSLHLTGPNGAGKSSLLRCLAGVMRPRKGRVLLEGAELPRPGRALGRLGLLAQNPARQLFEDSVHAEVGFSLRRMGLGREQIKRRVEEALDMCEVSHLADRPPLTLSFGEQHRVALAAALAPRPRVLLCDEPLTGLDLAQRNRVLSALARFGVHHGSALLIASHDPLPQAGWAQDSLRLEGGRLAAL
jgi:energy-coupling factor transporter ATP-binding protein EcfA2